MSGSGDDSERPRGPFSFTPIGWVASPYQRRFGTPQQASAVDSDRDAVLVLDPAGQPVHQAMVTFVDPMIGSLPAV